ncbi:hypothetical protein Tco_0161417 [Tanacetum coccineum]
MLCLRKRTLEHLRCKARQCSGLIASDTPRGSDYERRSEAHASRPPKPWTLFSSSFGDTNEYDQLIGNMHNNVHLVPDEVAMLVTILRALSGAVSYIDVVHHRALLSSIDRWGKLKDLTKLERGSMGQVD